MGKVDRSHRRLTIDRKTAGPPSTVMSPGPADPGEVDELIELGREAQRGLAGEQALRQGLSARQPNESARLRAPAKYLSATAGTPPPPGTGYF
jgi:hypothetical protein